MSDTQAAVATENGVSSNPVEEAPIFKVLLYFYSILKPHLIFSFERSLLEILPSLPLMMSWRLSFLLFRSRCTWRFAQPLRIFHIPYPSINAYIVRRGAGSAGYGFVGLATADAAQKAVQVLDQQELNGRQVIVQIAKHSGQNDRQKEDKRSKGRLGRRGGKAIPGEVSEAEANGDAEDTETAESGDAAQPKKSAVCPLVYFQFKPDISLSSVEARSLMPTELKLPRRLPPLKVPGSLVVANLGGSFAILALPTLLTFLALLANHPRPRFWLLTSDLGLVRPVCPHFSLTLAFVLYLLALSADGGVNQGKAGVMALWTSATRKNRWRPSLLWKARKLAPAVLLPSKLPLITLMMNQPPD